MNREDAVSKRENKNDSIISGIVSPLASSTAATSSPANTRTQSPSIDNGSLGRQVPSLASSKRVAAHKMASSMTAAQKLAQRSKAKIDDPQQQASPENAAAATNSAETLAATSEKALASIDTSAGRTSSERTNFDDRILHQLLTWNPESTTETLREIDNGRKLEKFWKFCKLHFLKPEHYRMVHSIEELNNNMSMIVSSIRSVLRSSQYLSFLSKRMLAGVHKAQRFIRHSLSALRRKKRYLLEVWKEAEKAARLKLREEIEAKARKLKSTQSAKFIEDMWEVYLDCWVPEDRMRRAIDELWRERRSRYVHGYRDWKARQMAEMNFTGKETVTSRKSRINALCLTYDLMNFRPEEVTMMEMLAHDHLLHLKEITSGMSSDDRRLQLIPREVGDVNKWESPVSFYHQLILFEKSEMYLCLFLKQLSKPDGLKLPPGAATTVREQAQIAKVRYLRWNAAVLPEDYGESLRSGIRSKKKKKTQFTLGPDGQPISNYCYNGSSPGRMSRSPNPRADTSTEDGGYDESNSFFSASRTTVSPGRHHARSQSLGLDDTARSMETAGTSSDHHHHQQQHIPAPLPPAAMAALRQQATEKARAAQQKLYAFGSTNEPQATLSARSSGKQREMLHSAGRSTSHRSSSASPGGMLTFSPPRTTVSPRSTSPSSRMQHPKSGTVESVCAQLQLEPSTVSASACQPLQGVLGVALDPPEMVHSPSPSRPTTTTTTRRSPTSSPQRSPRPNENHDGQSAATRDTSPTLKRAFSGAAFKRNQLASGDFSIKSPSKMSQEALDEAVGLDSLAEAHPPPAAAEHSRDQSATVSHQDQPVDIESYHRFSVNTMQYDEAEVESYWQGVKADFLETLPPSGVPKRFRVRYALDRPPSSVPTAAECAAEAAASGLPLQHRTFTAKKERPQSAKSTRATSTTERPATFRNLSTTTQKAAAARAMRQQRPQTASSKGGSSKKPSHQKSTHQPWPPTPSPRVSTPAVPASIVQQHTPDDTQGDDFAVSAAVSWKGVVPRHTPRPPSHQSHPTTPAPSAAGVHRGLIVPDASTLSAQEIAAAAERQAVLVSSAAYVLQQPGGDAEGSATATTKHTVVGSDGAVLVDQFTSDGHRQQRAAGGPAVRPQSASRGASSRMNNAIQQQRPTSARERLSAQRRQSHELRQRRYSGRPSIRPLLEVEDDGCGLMLVDDDDVQLPSEFVSTLRKDAPEKKPSGGGGGGQPTRTSNGGGNKQSKPQRQRGGQEAALGMLLQSRKLEGNRFVRWSYAQ